jgi:cell division septation protein DedD
MAASTMFYFEEDEKESELRSNRVDSISSRSTLSSTGSSPTRSRENLAVPQFVDLQENSVASTPIACSVTPTPPIDVIKTKKAGKSSSANGGKKTPTKVSGSPNVKRVRTRRADTISRSTFDG